MKIKHPLLSVEEQEWIRQMLDYVHETERNKAIFLVRLSGQTLRETGDKFFIIPERVRQIFRKCERKLEFSQAKSPMFWK